MKKILTKLMKEKKIISLHEESEDILSCSTGIILTIKNNHILFKAISEEGLLSGEKVINVNDIILVDFDGAYEKKVEFLYKENKVLSDDNLYDFGENLFISSLKNAKKNNEIAEVWVNDQIETLIGFICDVGKKLVHITIIDDYGEKYGETIFRLEYITRLEVNSIKHKVKKLLFEEKCKS